MSIEDIDYLLANSEKDSATFFIDSANRDKRYDVDPQQYTLQFSEPLRNVYGIEILDATIPVTMYNVDAFNSTFCYTRVFYAPGFNATDFKRVFAEVQDNTQFERVFEGTFTSDVFVCTDADAYAAIVAGVQDALVFSPHLVAHRRVVGTAQRVLDLTTEVDASTLLQFEYSGNSYTVPLGDAAAVEVVRRGQDFTVLGDGTLVAYETVYVSQANAQQLVIQQADAVGAGLAPVFDLYMSNIYMQIELGNYDGNTMFQYLQSELRTAAANATSAPLDATSVELSQLTLYGTLAKQFRIRFYLNDPNATLVLDMQKSTSRDIFGFSGLALDTSPRYERLAHRTNRQLFMSHTEVNPSPANIAEVPLVATLQADGIMNLQGLRYILLRVPEIEQHLLNSFAYGKYCPGIGMFKLTSGNEIAYLRFDFVNLVKKPFHPIGKLSKITLRFERSDGQLYDFKGVDYSLLIVVKFYAPKTAPRPPRSLLNPNYDPDFVAYQNQAPRRRVEQAYDVRDVLREQNKYDDEKGDHV